GLKKDAATENTQADSAKLKKKSKLPEAKTTRKRPPKEPKEDTKDTAGNLPTAATDEKVKKVEQTKSAGKEKAPEMADDAMPKEKDNKGQKKKKRLNKKSIAAKTKDRKPESVKVLSDAIMDNEKDMVNKKSKMKKWKAGKSKKEKPKKSEEKFLLEIASNVQVMRDYIVQQPAPVMECAPGVLTSGSGVYATPNIAGGSAAEQQTQKINARRNAYRLALADLYLNANIHCDIAQVRTCEVNKSCQAVLDGKITIKENGTEEKMQWHDEHGNQHLVFQYKYTLQAAFVCRCNDNNG
ncbi:MAG: hypothetical protein ACK4IY_10150, partial [Chitinophagales bacterium]